MRRVALRLDAAGEVRAGGGWGRRGRWCICALACSYTRSKEGFGQESRVRLSSEGSVWHPAGRRSGFAYRTLVDGRRDAACCASGRLKRVTLAVG
jgi:hypothetical protein